ncbi:hypothetical protein AV530_014918 [Patagioenas fasciata monilis]|uniref:Uncharacterized protein n=1 Tax=Patagioenas fasciata monilis TaxID=372326 RepID=A0A1V4K0A1_PATFA|nr:hypothetical protein AV530_014918 [Patagioenas fasciata monilis]
MLRSPPPFVAQLSRLKHPRHVGKRFTHSRDRRPGYQRSCPGGSRPPSSFLICATVISPHPALLSSNSKSGGSSNANGKLESEEKGEASFINGEDSP